MLLEVIERGSGGLGYICACMMYACGSEFESCPGDCGCLGACDCQAGACSCNSATWTRCGID